MAELKLFERNIRSLILMSLIMPTKQKKQGVLFYHFLIIILWLIFFGRNLLLEQLTTFQ